MGRSSKASETQRAHIERAQEGPWLQRVFRQMQLLMNSKDFLRLFGLGFTSARQCVALGQATLPVRDLVSKFILGGGDKSSLFYPACQLQGNGVTIR